MNVKLLAVLILLSHYIQKCTTSLKSTLIMTSKLSKYMYWFQHKKKMNSQKQNKTFS